MLWSNTISSIFIFLLLRIRPGYSKKDIAKRCETCKDMVVNFDKKLSQTAKHGFGGGNTDWEESRLGSYAKSESRLIEIMEGLCEGISKESICQAMVEEYESELYDWWYSKSSEKPALEKYLCIDHVKVCCPNNTYGPDCKECPGGKKEPCSGHGTCKDAGTRAKGGTCDCENGYEGDVCDSCKDGFYDAENSTCKECDGACKTTCSGEGAKNCDDCKEGWILSNDGEGCKDVDECSKDESPCSEGQFCVNTVGSYECKGCHDSCQLNCSGEGAVSCVECKEGYIKTDAEGCQDVDECSSNAECIIGTYCLNTVGSYQCEGCHESCALECTGPGNKACKTCKEGYLETEEGCTDIDECASSVECSIGTYCANTVGSYECEVCHESCGLECTGPGNKACKTCKDGYRENDGECIDIDECSEQGSSHLCKDPSQYCRNTPGSFECTDCDASCISCLAPGPTGCVKCKDGFVMKNAKCEVETKNDDADEEEHDEL